MHDNYLMLLLLHLGALIIHSISCGFAWGHNKSVFTNRNIWYTKFEYTSTNISVITDSTPVYVGEKQNYMSWVTANEFITALSHLLAIFTMLITGKYYNHTYEIGRRTVEYIMTAAVLQVALVLGAGDILFQDVVFIFVINTAIQYIGYQIDKIEYVYYYKDRGFFTTSERARGSDNWEFSAPLFGTAFLLLVSEIIYVYTLSTTIDFGPGPLEDQTTFLIFGGIMYIIFYVSFGLVKFIGHYLYDFKDNEDVIYVILSVTCKISLSWILIGNIYNGFYNLCEHTSNEKCEIIKKDDFYGNWNGAQIGFSIFGILGIILSVIYGYINAEGLRTERF